MQFAPAHMEHAVRIAVGSDTLEGRLALPAGATGIVVFAQAGGMRETSCNEPVASALRDAGFGTLTFSPPPAIDPAVELRARLSRFDIPLVAHRLLSATAWLAREERLRSLRIGYFATGASSAGALSAAAALGPRVSAVVMRGGRIDLAAPHFDRLTAPTLLIIAGAERALLGINENAYQHLNCTKRLVVVPCEDSGCADEIAALATDWYTGYLEAAVQV